MPSPISSPAAYSAEPAANTSMRCSTSFLDFPREMRDEVYAYVLSDSPPWAGETKIEFRDEKKASGDPIDICLKLHWYWFLANKQIVREGVEYAFRWTRVRFVGGPWVLQRMLQKIASPRFRLPSSPAKNVADRHASFQSIEDELAAAPYILASPPLTPNPPAPLLPLLRHLEIAWTTIPSDIGGKSVLARISSFELRPLFQLLASSLPNLEALTTSLRYRSNFASREGGLTRAEWFNIELCSYALALLLSSHATPTTSSSSLNTAPPLCSSLRALHIRYMARNPWAAMEPPLPLSLIVERNAFSLMRDEKLVELAAVLTGTREWGFGVSEAVLDISTRTVQWDPMNDTHMVGEEVEWKVQVKEGAQVVVPEGGMDATGRRKNWRVSVGLFAGSGEEDGEAESEDVEWEDEEREDEEGEEDIVQMDGAGDYEVDWTGFDDPEVYAEFLRYHYSHHEYSAWDECRDSEVELEEELMDMYDAWPGEATYQNEYEEMIDDHYEAMTDDNYDYTDSYQYWGSSSSEDGPLVNEYGELMSEIYCSEL